MSVLITTLRVELIVRIFKDIIDRPADSTADFINEEFDCNRAYQPTVRAILSNTEIIDNGIPVFYGGNSMINILNHAYMHIQSYTCMLNLCG